MSGKLIIRQIKKMTRDFTKKNYVLSLDRKSREKLKIREIEKMTTFISRKNAVLPFDRKSRKLVKFVKLKM